MHRDGEGKVALHAVQHSDPAGEHFHSARRQLVIEGFGWSCPHPAIHLEHGFAAQMFSNSEGLGTEVGIHRDLYRSAAIAQVDENHAAVIAASIHPAAQLHLLINVLLTQVAATVAAHGMYQVMTGEFPIARVLSSTSVKGSLHHRCRLHLTSDLHAELAANLGQMRWHDCKSDGLFKGG